MQTKPNESEGATRVRERVEKLLQTEPWLKMAASKSKRRTGARKAQRYARQIRKAIES